MRHCKVSLEALHIVKTQRAFMSRRISVVMFLLSATTSFAQATESVTSTTVPKVLIKASKPVLQTANAGPRVLLTQEQMRDTSAQDLGQVLQNLGGLRLIDTTGNGSQTSISLRGFGSNATSNTLLLINGIPITNPDLASPDLSLIPLNEIQYIEIIAGSESVLYGDQAVGGVIHIMTQQKNPEKGALSCQIGSYTQRYCYGTLYHHYRDLNFNLFAGSKHSDNYRLHNDYDQNQVMGGLAYPYQTGSLRFDFNVGNEAMQYPGALTAAQVHQNRRQANNDTDFFKNWNAFSHLQHRQIIFDNWQLNSDLVRREMHGHGVLTTPFNQSRLTYYLKPQLVGKINTVALQSGLELQNDRYHLGSLFGLTENTQQKYGGFVLATAPLKEKLILSLGTRGAMQVARLQNITTANAINRALATTLGLAYEFNQQMHVYLRRSGSFRFPKADENTFTVGGVGSLRTQRGIAYESGLQYNSGQHTGRVDLYQLNLRDEIAFDPTQSPEQPFGTNRNLSPTVRRGCSLGIHDQLTPAFGLGGQYNYVNARFQHGVNSGNRIPLVAENILIANINYTFYEHWKLYSEAVYTSNQFPANDDANVSGPLGGYTLVNASLRYELKNLSISLRINNIFNKAYYFYTAFQANTNQVTFYPAPESNWLLTVKYVFT